jgi:putative transposase
MCKVLDVSRSGYYAWRGRPPSEREMANQKLYKEINGVKLFYDFHDSADLLQ